MRTGWLLGVVVAVLSAMTGCSPAHNSIAAIGLDGNGRLVGAVKVCSKTIVQAAVESGFDDPSETVEGSWRRTAAMQGTEWWPLTGPGGGHWYADGPRLAGLQERRDYLFGAWDATQANGSGWLEFNASDLAGLRPGQVLVERYVERRDGLGTGTMVVIPLDDLWAEPCG